MPDPYWLRYFSTRGEVHGRGTGPAGLAGAGGLAGAAGGAAAAGFSAVGFFSPSGGGGAGDLTSSGMPGSWLTTTAAKARQASGNLTLLTGGCGYRQRPSSELCCAAIRSGQAMRLLAS